MDYSGGSEKADHLCVVVHGLWGNPNHMKTVVKTLRDAYSEDELYILLPKRNKGSSTYDGIERGGERVCEEIQEELRKIEANGGNITKLSVVGYSLGGLVSRYAVGLLHAKGVLDQLRPMNFTTFASPHLGVRSPLRGWHNHIWNVLGARTLSMSGRQLFTIDDFRDTGRPLLSIMADPDSIFMEGLSRFKRKTLYANIAHDRSVPYYTACIAKTDPYRNIEKVKFNYVPGYEEVVLDPINPVRPSLKPDGMTLESFANNSWWYLKNAPKITLIAVFIPIAIVGYLLNSVVQNLRSSKRIRLHESGLAGIEPGKYRVPIMMQELRQKVEDAYEDVNNSQQQEYLASSDDDENEGVMNEKDRKTLARERRMSHPQWPTLALAPYQFDMINQLDGLGWRKYPVYLRKNLHTHAAIIVRMNKASFVEGYTVMKHWIKEEFLI
ncbi:lipase/serine esterase [Apiospora kogelbergensis]|uniref:lipase/serine esterase n=1 Tax=Apiospora kogelbergensis TaxID=1337665 RepID=UPI003131AE0A